MAARNTDILERVTTVLENLVPAHRSQIVVEFLQLNPPKFEGGFQPERAERWLQDLEKIFRTMGYSDTQRVTCATYVLVGEAENWWEHNRQLLGVKPEEITWDGFKESFLEKYLPENIRRRKEIEFLELKQGDLSVGEYAAKFESLIKYSPYFQNHPDEHSKCIKFGSGLRPEIRLAIGYQNIQRFPLLVNMCQTYEEDLKTKERHESDHSNSKKWGPIRKKDKGPQQSERSYPSTRAINKNHKGGTSHKHHMTSPPRCSSCHKLHFGKCRYEKEILCLKCNKSGHIARSCTERP